MTLQASGAISLGDIQTEFGGSNPIGLNEYYRNGPYVSGTQEEIPQSGPIAISNFYNTTSEYYVDYTAAEISDYSTNVTWGDRTWIGVRETYTGSWPFHGYCLTGVDQILYYRAFQKGPVDLRFTNKYSGTYRFTVSNSTSYGNIGNTTQKIYQDGVLKGTNVCSFGGSSTLDVYLEVGTEIRITSESDNSHYYNVQAGSMTVAPSEGDGLRTFTS